MLDRKMMWKPLGDAFLNLLYPQEGKCLFCLHKDASAEQTGICRECAAGIMELCDLMQNCLYCGYFTDGEECPNCRCLRGTPLEVGTVVPYEGRYREIIHNLKYNGRKELARPLGYLMAQRVKRLGWARNVGAVVPVPLFTTREKERGFNQSLLLAKAVAEDLGKPLWNNLLSREHFHHPQMVLSREERLKNIIGAFKYASTRKLAGETILLVDDIITTGATLRGCADVLRQAGVQRVYGLTWAAGYNVSLMERLLRS